MTWTFTFNRNQLPHFLLFSLHILLKKEEKYFDVYNNLVVWNNKCIFISNISLYALFPLIHRDVENVIAVARDIRVKEKGDIVGNSGCLMAHLFIYLFIFQTCPPLNPQRQGLQQECATNCSLVATRLCEARIMTSS